MQSEEGVCSKPLMQTHTPVRKKVTMPCILFLAITDFFLPEPVAISDRRINSRVYP